MNHEKLREFSVIAATISACMEGLLKAQELLVDLICKECDIPEEMKTIMIDDMNKAMGIKKL